ncbi:MAG: CRISPR-associated endoribonuclease Cas6 [Candidatus Aminicenantes bacterium]|nr:CRISPR-associated endoribonuclease Cas6 [Candidatus Aminicenantes bacterium]
MRLRIKFTGDTESIILPFHYNEILHGIVYHYLNTPFALRMHAKGFIDPESNRGLKLFTFSRLISSKKPEIDKENNAIKFYFPITWIIASPLHEFIISLYNTLNRKRSINLHGSTLPTEQNIYLLNLWLEKPPPYNRPVLVETLSPITVYRTSEKDGKLFTHYFKPSDPEFNELILSNLLRKYRVLTGKKLTLDKEAFIRPVRISHRENIIYFKDTVIKGWSGNFELSLPEELFPLAFSCGLGAKNSLGFGCIGIWRGNK